MLSDKNKKKTRGKNEEKIKNKNKRIIIITVFPTEED